MDVVDDRATLAFYTLTAPEIWTRAQFLCSHLQSLRVFESFRELTYLIMVGFPHEKMMRVLLVEGLYLPLCDYFVAPPRHQAVASGRFLSEFCNLRKVEDLSVLTPALGLLRYFLAS